MATVVGSFELADGVPDTGKVSMWPSVTAADLTPTARTITQGHVTSVLDETGSVVFDVLASDDDGWQLEDGAMMPYTVEWRLGSGYRKPYEVYLVGAGPHDLTTMLPIEGVDVAPYPVPGAKGDQGEVAVDSTVTGAPGTPALVEDLDASPHKALLRFTVPEGLPGVAATVDAGATITGAPGTLAQVVNTGDTTAAIFDFTIPRGDPGAQGPPGVSGASAFNYRMSALADADVDPGSGNITIETTGGQNRRLAISKTDAGGAPRNAGVLLPGSGLTIVYDADATPPANSIGVYVITSIPLDMGTWVKVETIRTQMVGTPAVPPAASQVQVVMELGAGDYYLRSDLLTTKGDLVARDATQAVRLPVGSLKGMALTVDPAAAAGVAWAPPIGTVTLWADLPTYTTVPLGTRYHVTSGLGTLYALRGPTGWVVSADSDTGWLTLTERLNGFSGGTIRVNRTGPHVEWVVATVNGTAATASQILAIASGFRVPHNSTARHVEAVSGGGAVTWAEAWQYQNQLLTPGRGTSLAFDMTYMTLDAWPTVAPS